MKKLNSSGFGLVEGLLILVIVGIIGGAGVYVYKTNESTNENLDTIGNSEVLKTEKAEHKKEKPADPTEGWKIYTGQELPFTFKYPPDWQVKTTSDFYAVTVEAPGTTLKNTAIGGTEVEKGAEFRLFKGSGKPKFNTIKDYEKSRRLVAQFGTSKKNISVDGREGLEYKLAYEGPATHGVVFLDNGIDYEISVEQSVYSKSEYSKVFDKLVKSIKFN